MAGIGDYVHYHHSRYLKYGINANSGSNDLGASLRSTHEWLKAQTAEKKINVDLHELEKYYNNIIYSKGLDTLNSPIEDSDTTMAEILTDFIQSTVEKTAKVTDINRSLTQPTSSLRGKTDVNWDKKTISAKEVAILIKNLAIARQNSHALIQRAINNPQNFLAFESDEQALKKRCKELSLKLQELEDEIQSQNPNLYTKAGKIRKRSDPQIEKDGDITALLKEVKNFLDLYRGYYGSQIAGEGLEGIFTAINIGFNNTLVNGYKQCMGNKDAWKEFLGKHGKVGNLTTTVSYSNISDLYVDKESLVNDYFKNYKWDMQTGQISLKGAGPNQTVDVVIQVEDNEDLRRILGEGNSLNASLKNLSDIKTSNIQVIKDTNLLNILSLFADSNFANHYLNLYGVHVMSGSSRSLDAEFQTANEYVKYMTALRGLQGFGTGMALADIIVVNNRQTKHLYIRSISSILNKAFSQGDIDTYFKFNGGIPTKRDEFKNPWVGGAYNINTHKIAQRNHDRSLAIQRITAFIASVHDMKIVCSMTPAALFYQK